MQIALNKSTEVLVRKKEVGHLTHAGTYSPVANVPLRGKGLVKLKKHP